MMISPITTHSPKVVIERTSYVCGAFALATAAQQFFKFKTPWKSHLTFSLVQGGASTLLFHFKQAHTFYDQQRDPQKKQILGIIYFVLFFSLPAFMGRSIASWCFEQLSYKKMAKCAVLNWVGLGVTIFGIGTYRLRQQTLPGS